MSFWNYIIGKRKGKEVNRLEKEAMKDPFLADAMEGFDKFKKDHSVTIEDLRQQITRQTRNNTHWVRNMSVAASLLIIIGLGCLWIFNHRDIPGKNELASMEIAEILSEQPSIISEEITNADLTMDQMESLHTKDQSVEEKIVIVENKLSGKPDISEGIGVDAIAMNEAKLLSLSEDVLDDFSDLSLSLDILENNMQSGYVRNVAGEYLIGAKVSLAGTDTFTSTNPYGYFEIPVKDSGKLSFDYLGFNSDTVSVNTQQQLWVTLEERQDLFGGLAQNSPSKRNEITGLQKSKERIIFPNKKNDNNFSEYVKKELKYPLDEGCKDVEGTVELIFYVDSLGRPYNIEVKKSVCDSIDREAVRLLKEGPDWFLTEKQIKQKIEFRKK